MKVFLIYQAEVAICLGVFYVFYKLFLSKDVSHQLKRGYLIIASMMAFTIPALTFSITLNSDTTPAPIAYFSQITGQFTTASFAVQRATHIDPWQILIWIWTIGLIIMLLRLIISLYQVNKILNEATTVPNHSFKISTCTTQSFSFFRAVVLNIRHYQSPALKYILAHEKTHASQLHTLDILFVEMVKSLQWFNPFAWLFAYESALNLEYIADDQVISEYTETKMYQLAIVQFSQHSSGKLLRTEFSKSNLKNRIAMMNQTNNSNKPSWRYLLVVPVVTVLLSSFSLKIENLNLSKEISALLPHSVGVGEKILDKIPLIEHLADTKKDYPKQIINEKIGLAVKPLSSITDKHVEPAKAMQTNEPGAVNNDKVLDEAVTDSKNTRTNPDNATFNSLPSMVQQDTSRLIKGRVTSQDGSPVSGVNIIIRGTSIGAVTDMDGEFAILVGNSYHELVIASPDNRVQVIDISEGVDFIVTLKSDQKGSDLPLDRSSNMIWINSVVTDTGVKVPMYILDKEQVSSDILMTIDPNNIREITIHKGESAIKLYGDKAINGVVIIELKKKPKKKKKG